MKHKHISALSLAVFGAASAYSQITLNPVPERSLGTPQLNVSNSIQSPNLVAGREFNLPQSVALDTSVSPPIVYVSDYVNNRVLAWKNANTFTTGQVADLAIGQPDLVTTFPAGPDAVAQKVSTYTTGLYRPTGLAVDQNGNLYVADGGNNRVLRYPKPFAQTSLPEPDLWIGQASPNGYGANSPTNTQTPTAQGLFLNSSSGVFVSSLAFDSSGNLWVVDTGNSRVLRFNATSLSAGGGSQTADIELGQPNFTSISPALNSGSASSFLTLNQFFQPTALGFDASGNLFVGDLNRVLVFTPPFTAGMSASSHILGVFPSGYTFPTNATAHQALLDSTALYSPSGLFFPTGSAAGVGVVDAGYNRIMIYPPFASWPANGVPPAATAIVGQPNTTCTATAAGTCKAPNNGNPQPSSSTLYAPEGAVYTGTDLYLADAANNRVLDLPQQSATFGPATRILGQDYPYANSPNLIEGREFQFTGSEGSDAGMAIDNSSGTPHLYVADPYNNRVLGFKDLRTFQNGAANKADIVIGQKDFTTALINYPSGDANTPTGSSLYRPIGLLVDAQGNLYVADSLNARVLRFPAPFAYTGAAPEPADLVLGQSNFTTTISDPTHMLAPYGLAFTPSCNTLTPPCPAPNGLLVSDQLYNRVLYIPATNGTFAAGSDNGKAATVVFGQSSFSGTGAGNGLASLNQPHHVSCDTDGNVYVADTGNGRVLIFPDPHGPGTAATGQAAPAYIANLNSPESVFANPQTGEIWVADTGAGESLRYENYQSVLLGQGSVSGIAEVSGSGCPTGLPCFTYAPLAAIQDQYGDLFVADNAHRVALYYRAVNLCNGASFLPVSPTSAQYPSATCLPLYSLTAALPANQLAPGTIATIFPCSTCQPDQFGDTQSAFNGTYPVPTTLSGVQVLVNGVPAPLYYVGPPIPPSNPTGQINFIVPIETPQSGNADLEVIQVSTGQVLGAAQVPMSSVAPGAFPNPLSGTQTGATFYAAAENYNADGSYGGVNSASNPAIPGGSVVLYMTGQGAIPGEPADGVQATAPLSAQYGVTVIMNDVDVNSPQYQESNIQHILYSGINQIPGIWQINVLIPKTVVPKAGAVSFATLIGGVSNWNAASPFETYIYVK